MDRDPVVNASEAGPSAYATYREASLSQLERYMAEAAALSAERQTLGKSTADKKRRDAIDEDLADIRGNSDALRLCLDIEKDLRARRDEAVTLRTGEAAAAAPVPLQQQPAKPKAFTMPDTKLFPNTAREDQCHG